MRILFSLLALILLWCNPALSQNETIEDVSVEDPVPAELQALGAYSVGLEDLTESRSKEAVEIVSKAVFAGTDNRGAKAYDQFMLHLLLAGQNNTATKMLTQIVERLNQPGDPKLEVRIARGGGLISGFYIENKTIVINLGVLGFVKNVDELAAVISVQMERAKIRIVDSQNVRRKTQVQQYMDSNSSLAGMLPLQKELMESDLRSVDRLLKAGYNPKALYHLYKRFADTFNTRVEVRFSRWLFGRNEKEAIDFHGPPRDEVRMSAVKAYIGWKQEREDLSKYTSSYKEFNKNELLLKLRMYVYQIPTNSKWYQRSKEVFYLWLAWTTASKGYGAIKAYAAAGATGNTAEIEKVTKELEKSQWTIIWEQVGEQFRTRFPDLYEVSEPYRETISKLTEFNNIVLLGTGAFITWGAVWLFKTMYRESIREDMTKFHELELYRKISRDLRDVFSGLSAKGKFDADIALRMLKLNVSALNSVQHLYKTAEGIAAYRYFDGLTLMRFQSSSLIADILGDSTLKTNINSNNKTTWDSFAAELNKLPIFIYEKNQAREALFAFSKLSSQWRNTQSFVGYSLTALPGETTFEHTARLIEVAKNQREAMTGETAAELFVLLYKMGALTTARQLYFAKREMILSHTLSPNNKNAKLAAELSLALTKVRKKRTLKNARIWQTVYQDIMHIASVIKSKILEPSSPGLEGIGVKSVLDNVETSWPRWKSVRHNMNKYTHREFKEFFNTNFKTATEVRDYIDKNLISKNTIMISFSSDLVALIAARPELIMSMQDVEALISREYFWPIFNGSSSNPGPLESIFMASIIKFSEKFPDIWKYEPASAEKIHNTILSRLKTLGLWQETPAFKKSLWKMLTKRGITSVTDSLFHDIYEHAEGAEKTELEKLALEKGLVWEVEIKSRMARKQMLESPEYKQLLTLPSQSERTKLIEAVIAKVQKNLPEKGYGFETILEELSVNINSNRIEAVFIENQKRSEADDKESIDLGSRVMQDIVGRVLNWKKSNQWAFLQYIREQGPVTPKIQKAFKTIGPERVRRMFSVLPVEGKTLIIDSIMDAPSGIIPKGNFDSGYGKMIIDELLVGSDSKMADVSRQVLDAFIAALKQIHNSEFRSYILSYILALPPAEKSSPGMVLKKCLEIIGLTGVKLGQFLAATDILSESDTKILSELQERANKPKRFEMFEDLVEVFGERKWPFEVYELKGAASVKYAIRAKDTKTNKDMILKVFRVGAFAKAKMQYQLLEQMAIYLRTKHGPEYGVLKSIVRASIEAVKRELDSLAEAERSKTARQKIYNDKSDKEMEVRVPFDLRVHRRLIGAEYAEGVSIHDLPVEHRLQFAERILEIEKGILFSNSNTIEFEPDRHAGNYRVHVQKDTNSITLKLFPIDFGQLNSISRSNRDRVFELIAMSEVLKQTGETSWATDTIGQWFALDAKQKTELSKAIGQYFPKSSLSTVAAYFSLLAALEDAGKPLGIEFFDYMRAIIQLKQYDAYISPAKVKELSMSELLREKVEPLARKMEVELRGSLGMREGMKVLMRTQKEKGVVESVKQLLSMASARLKPAAVKAPIPAQIPKPARKPITIDSSGRPPCEILFR